MSSSIDDALGRALDSAAEATRAIPKTAAARMRYVVKQFGGTKAAAAQLGVSQRTVQRYLAGQRKTPPKEVADRLAGAVRSTWQPRVRARAARRAATESGVTVYTRARFGYWTPAAGGSDDARMRQLTVHLPPEYAGQLLEEKENGASEERMRSIIAEGLQNEYFRRTDNNTENLVVQYTEVDHVEMKF